MFLRLFLAISRNSGFILWFSLEINLLSFLPIMSFEINSNLENSLKYFLIQSLGSSLFLFICFYSKYFIIGEQMILLALILKLGGAPFHRWLLSILNDIRVKTYLFLTSPQKLIPLVIISIIRFREILVSCSIGLNFLFIILNGIGSIPISKILALSRLNRLSWILASLFGGIRLLLLFLFIYTCLIIGILAVVLPLGNRVSIKLQDRRYFNKILCLFVFLSLGGVPPFLGFLGKVIVLKVVIIFLSLLATTLLVMGALVILYYYVRFRFIIITFKPKSLGYLPVKNFSTTKILYFFSICLVWAILSIMV